MDEKQKYAAARRLRATRAKFEAGEELFTAFRTSARSDEAVDAAVRQLYIAIPFWWRMWHGSWSESLREHDLRVYYRVYGKAETLRLFDRAMARTADAETGNPASVRAGHGFRDPL